MEILIIALLVLNLVAIFFLWRHMRTPKSDSQGLMLLQNQLQDMVRQTGDLARIVDRKMGEGTEKMFESMKEQFGESQRLASDIRDLVSRQLTEVAREQTKTNEATGKFVAIAQQLANLEKVLTHQKQRGNWGEASLELVLGGFLPPTAYEMQYQFPNGEVVDAAIFTKDGVIPVDAKFSLDNYTRLINAVDEEQREALEK
ncbi:MAG TPA: DNA recombination protein RmuC, partial [Candidatus Paceibacterota bacterium]